MRLFPKIRRNNEEKAVGAIRHSQSFANLFLRPEKVSDRRMREDLGIGVQANVVMSPVSWIQRSMQESPVRAVRTNSEGGEEFVHDHPAKLLLDKPNEFYSTEHLLAATIFSLVFDGNCYWVAEENRRGLPERIWYIPHWLIEPKWPQDGSEFISHYEYKPSGMTQRLEVEDVVHFRIGINPINLRKGLSPLSGLIREVWSDMESSVFVSSILRNGGVPGVVFSPRNSDTSAAQLSPEDVQELKRYLETNYGGEERGRPLVASTDVRVEQFGFSPSQLDLSSVRNSAEERVCAALGIPAAVVGFGSGMEQTKVGATMRELRREAWHGGVIPMQSLIASELTRSLVPMLRSRQNVEIQFDNSRVYALREDENEREKRINARFEAGYITVNEARVTVGYDEVPGGEVYKRKISEVYAPLGENSEPNPEEEIEQRSLLLGHASKLLEKQHDHTAVERMASESPQVSEVPQQVQQFQSLLVAMREPLEQTFRDELRQFFDRLGDKAGDAADKVLQEKASVDDMHDAARILEGMSMSDELPIFRQMFETHFQRTAEQVHEGLVSFMSLDTGLPDPVARSIIATGGRRAGFVDISVQSREAILNALVEGRAAGEGADALARRVRENVPAGPWSSSDVRSRVIARTETRFAQSFSVIAEAEGQSGIDRVMVHDARLGSTDAICEALDGRVVPVQDARQLMEDEHPNGTRSFTPISQTLAEELGV